MQTSKSLRRITSTRAVWISLVKDLRALGFIDRLSIGDIETLPTAELVAVVKRLVVGPESWSMKRPSGSSLFSKIFGRLLGPRQNLPVLQAEISERLVLHPPTSTQTPNRGEREAKLLRGGEFVLFNRSHVLECWRVDGDVLLWTHHSSIPHPNVATFAVEVVDNGERANIMICITSTMSPFDMRK